LSDGCVGLLDSQEQAERDEGDVEGAVYARGLEPVEHEAGQREGAGVRGHGDALGGDHEREGSGDEQRGEGSSNRGLTKQGVVP